MPIIPLEGSRGKSRNRSRASRRPGPNAEVKTSILPAPNTNTTRRRKIVYSLAALAGLGALFLYNRGDKELARELVTDASPAFSGMDIDDARVMFRELAQGRTLDLSGAVSKVKGLLSMKGGKRRMTMKNKRRSH